MLVNLIDKEMLRFEDKFVSPSWPPTPEQEGGHPYTIMYAGISKLIQKLYSNHI